MIERLEASADRDSLDAERRLGLWRGDLEAQAGAGPAPGLVTEIGDQLDLLEHLLS
jgi:hypothetical protein